MSATVSVSARVCAFIAFAAFIGWGFAGCSDRDEAGDVEADDTRRSRDAEPDESQSGQPEDAKGWRAKAKEIGSRAWRKAAEVEEAAEAALGAELKPAFVARNGGAYPDRELHAYLEGIVLRMAGGTTEPDMAWEFEILNSGELNAYALPGGKVFITRGLLAALESEAQFAHVMGHEMGHVVRRHMIRKLGVTAARSLFLRAAATAERRILEKDPDDPVFVTAALGVGTRLAFFKYSRDQELESDRCGIDYAVAAGYDPREGRKTMDLFLRMKEASGQGESLLAELLSTHPLDSDRIARTDEYLRDKHPEIARGERALVSSPREWIAHRDRLRGVGGAYEKHRKAMALVAKAMEAGSQDGLAEALALLDQAIDEVRDHATLHFARGYVQYLLGRDGEAERDMDRAIALDGANFQARLLRGILRLKAKRHAEAVEDLDVAAELSPADPAPHLYLGECLEALGRSDEAVAAYEQAILRAPEGSTFREHAERRRAALRAAR